MKGTYTPYARLKNTKDTTNDQWEPSNNKDDEGFVNSLSISLVIPYGDQHGYQEQCITCEEDTLPRCSCDLRHVHPTLCVWIVGLAIVGSSKIRATCYDGNIGKNEEAVDDRHKVALEDDEGKWAK